MSTEGQETIQYSHHSVVEMEEQQSEQSSMRNTPGQEKALGKFEKSLFALVSGYVFYRHLAPLVIS